MQSQSYQSASREIFLSGWGQKPYKAEESGFVFDRVRSVEVEVRLRKDGGAATTTQPIAERYPICKNRRQKQGCEMEGKSLFARELMPFS
jgi:hypothetical protein